MKITVAGAGHGGLVVAALLAKSGHDVTVYEKKKRDELGHDWEDRFTFSLLEEIIGKKIPDTAWRYRGDCSFVSPSRTSNVVINYNDSNRQKIMWRKYLIGTLLDFAEESGVRFEYGSEVLAPVIKDNAVTGIKTEKSEVLSDFVIDAAGVFSPLRTNLPELFGIEKTPARGDLFYAKRAYFNKTDEPAPEIPFEICLCHNREQGLSWCCVNEDSVDILIGRIDPLPEGKFEECAADFRLLYPCTGDKILHGGQSGVIPVRRPLAIMVAPGYAAVGDSAFMTTPMNGMGIDLSLNAGRLLAQTIIKYGSADIETLWEYNRQFHIEYGGITAKNEGLKNSLLEMPGEGVDFLFDNGVIQSSDLAGAGSKTSIGSLLGKFVRGMRNPAYFFAIINGLIKGAKLKKALENAPADYNTDEIFRWQESIENTLVRVKRKG
ncbi:MAG: NAD(P)/FAD-dependent oxidoreductase [Clostridia bacterium]|nr:NAD(P)/FAD-dependent oxidoreductase [Clostridia bacterium]